MRPCQQGGIAIENCDTVCPECGVGQAAETGFDAPRLPRRRNSGHARNQPVTRAINRSAVCLEMATSATQDSILLSELQRAELPSPLRSQSAIWRRWRLASQPPCLLYSFGGGYGLDPQPNALTATQTPRRT